MLEEITVCMANLVNEIKSKTIDTHKKGKPIWETLERNNWITEAPTSKH